MKRSSTAGFPHYTQSNHIMTDKMKNRALDFTVLSLLFLGFLFNFIFSNPSSLKTLFSSSNPECKSSTTMMKMIIHRDELDEVLAETSMENKTVIIAMVNKAYVEGDKSILDLFLGSFWLGDGTQGLINHLLIVATDEVSYQRYYLEMMWRRTQFLGDVLKRGYNFISTDTDILWLRNPISILSSNETIDFQIATDFFNGSNSDHLNNGFSFVRSNNKTISLFDYWYVQRKDYGGCTGQFVLVKLLKNGLFKDLGLTFRFKDTLYFSGFWEKSRDVGVVVTVHANCCHTTSAKVDDLTTVIHHWKRATKLSANETSTFRWPEHVACINSWKNYTNPW
ncbi:hypothetical protein RHSIM_Rhsim03G0156000 [Rhododendron simsii]|uniref:Nucleotide-diphospho-sugar transferase domain-containing protein n=1 Tax=Rhododendron simsii TaxID=118357 RepID=A0A834H817_RHOSS|nr:hypothetical protein RHSIM_Rhsim03G0156000 [Rhododendron simsii]